VSGVGDMQLDAAVEVVGDLANAFATAVRCGDLDEDCARWWTTGAMVALGALVTPVQDMHGTPIVVGARLQEAGYALLTARAAATGRSMHIDRKESL
jgi:hypothetical protein